MTMYGSRQRLLILLLALGFLSPACDGVPGAGASDNAIKQQKSLGEFSRTELDELSRLTASWSPLKLGLSSKTGHKFTGGIPREELDALKKYGFLLAVIGNEHGKGEKAYKKFIDTLRMHKVRTCLHKPGAQALIETYLTSSREQPNAKEHERFARELFAQIDDSEYEQDRQKVAYLYMGFWLGSAAIKAGSHKTDGITKMGEKLASGLRRGNPPDKVDSEHAKHIENIMKQLGDDSPSPSKIRKSIARVLEPEAGV